MRDMRRLAVDVLHSVCLMSSLMFFNIDASCAHHACASVHDGVNQILFAPSYAAFEAQDQAACRVLRARAAIR